MFVLYIMLILCVFHYLLFIDYAWRWNIMKHLDRLLKRKKQVLM